MKHLGRIQGGGDLKCGDETLARADYDFDGYLIRSGEVLGSGELRIPSDTLREVFGRGDLHLLTDDGRLLSLRFSEKQLPEASEAAHVDVASDLPLQFEWRR